MWTKLSDDKGVPDDVTADYVRTKVNEDIFTPKLGYRLISHDRVNVDAFVGMRYWHLGATLTLQPPDGTGGHYGAANWVDALGGGRLQFALTPKLGLTIAGDAGAGGANLDYQVVGLLGYRLKRATLQGGWRYLVVHRSQNQDTFVNAGMTGVVFGVVIPIK
jgi:hypothetical protein